MLQLIGLRKPPQSGSGSSYDYLLAQWKEMKNIINEQARRRFQQERQQQQQYSFSNNEPLADEVSGPGFTYQLPQMPAFSSDEEPLFAVGPSHPKFYEKVGIPIKDETTQSQEPVFTYKKVLGAENDPVHLTSDGIFHKVKAPMNVNPKIIETNDDNSDADNENTYDISKSKNVWMREDLKKFYENLERTGDGKAIVNVLQTQNDVAKKPVDLNSAWVIAGKNQ